MIKFLTIIQILILKIVGCKYLLAPIPMSDDVAVKWSCYDRD